jgi:hypothetical protein
MPHEGDVEDDPVHPTRRRWLRLLPAIFITYSFAYVDRANYGFGAAAGMAKDLHIDSSALALAASLLIATALTLAVRRPGVRAVARMA